MKHHLPDSRSSETSDLCHSHWYSKRHSPSYYRQEISSSLSLPLWICSSAKRKVPIKTMRELKQHSQAAVLQYHDPHVHCGNVLQRRAALMRCWFRYLTNGNDFGYLPTSANNNNDWGGKLSVYNIKIISSWCQYLYVLCFIIIIMCVQFDWRFIIIFRNTAVGRLPLFRDIFKPMTSQTQQSQGKNITTPVGEK